MKVCHEVIPPKLIVSVPKPDDRKKKAAGSLDDIIQKQMEMMKRMQTVEKKISESNPLASPQSDSTLKSLPERNISKKVSQNQECRKPDTDYSLVSNDSEYPTEVKKWAVHSNRISTDGNIPMENKQTSLKSFQLASLAEALSRPEMKYVQQKTDSTTRKIQNEIPNPSYVSGYKSASSGGDQELTKKVYGTKELLRFKENQGAGFVERKLRERHEEDMDVDYADVSVRQALGGARTYTKSSKSVYTKSSKSVRSPIDLDIQYDDLAKERGAQVAVIKSEGKEIQRKEPEIENPSKPDVYQPDVYQPRGLRRRECPKGHMLFRDDEKCRWCDPFRDSPV
uniref:Uncharacterized protein n=1 Tax=Magallana gigas TaxID=29159 RepID=A0A8W8N629_MAGGI